MTETQLVASDDFEELMAAKQAIAVLRGIDDDVGYPLFMGYNVIGRNDPGATPTYNITANGADHPCEFISLDQPNIHRLHATIWISGDEKDPKFSIRCEKPAGGRRYNGLIKLNSVDQWKPLAPSAAVKLSPASEETWYQLYPGNLLVFPGPLALHLQRLERTADVADDSSVPGRRSRAGSEPTQDGELNVSPIRPAAPAAQLNTDHESSTNNAALIATLVPDEEAFYGPGGTLLAPAAPTLEPMYDTQQHNNRSEAKAQQPTGPGTAEKEGLHASWMAPTQIAIFDPSQANTPDDRPRMGSSAAKSTNRRGISPHRPAFVINRMMDANELASQAGAYEGISQLAYDPRPTDESEAPPTPPRKQQQRTVDAPPQRSDPPQVTDERREVVGNRASATESTAVPSREATRNASTAAHSSATTPDVPPADEIGHAQPAEPARTQTIRRGASQSAWLGNQTSASTRKASEPRGSSTAAAPAPLPRVEPLVDSQEDSQDITLGALGAMARTALSKALDKTITPGRADNKDDDSDDSDDSDDAAASSVSSKTDVRAKPPTPARIPSPAPPQPAPAAGKKRGRPPAAQQPQQLMTEVSQTAPSEAPAAKKARTSSKAATTTVSAKAGTKARGKAAEEAASVDEPLPAEPVHVDEPAAPVAGAKKRGRPAKAAAVEAVSPPPQQATIVTPARTPTLSKRASAAASADGGSAVKAGAAGAPHFVLTGFSAQERPRLKKMVEKLGGIVDEAFESSTSILIAPHVLRTKHFCVACCRADVIVSHAYIDACVAAGTFVEPSGFAPTPQPDDKLLKDIDFGRILQSRPSLPTQPLKNCRFYLVSTTPNVGDITSVIEDAGGTVLSDAKDVRSTDYVVWDKAKSTEKVTGAAKTQLQAELNTLKSKGVAFYERVFPSYAIILQGPTAKLKKELVIDL